MEIEIQSPIVTGMMQPEIQPGILAARQKDLSIKLFYAMMREAREQGEGTIVDIGSTVDVADEDQEALHDIIDAAHIQSKRDGHYIEYASSWGRMELREAASEYFAQWGGVAIDPKKEVMVTRGIIDSYARVLAAFDWQHVAIPDWVPYYARSKPIINRVPIVDVPFDLETGNLRLDVLDRNLQASGSQPGKTLLYITHPASPIGTVMDDKFIEDELLPFCRQRGIMLFSDSYISATSFTGHPLRPILSYRGAKDVTVEAITVSKELGLPGARAGALAGNEHIINGVRLLAATEVDIVPGHSQILAAHGLRYGNPERVGARIRRELESEILPRFGAMGWPVIPPKAGIDMVIAVPPGYCREDVNDPSLLAAVSLVRKYGVAFCPASVFGPDGKHMLRIVLKQKEGKIPNALDRLVQQGFDWATDAPTAEDMNYLADRFASLDLTKL